MWNQNMFGMEVYQLMHLFFIYSIMGWVVESIYMSICNRKLTNRGFVFGPICPIYGVGALTVYVILRPFEGNYVALYFYGSALATILEYITAKIMLSMFGTVWWDYHDKPFNYKGILCLESTIAWGFYTVFLFAFLHKFAMGILGSYSYRTGRYIGLFLMLYFMLDFLYHLYKAKADDMPRNMDEIKETLRSIYRG